jgi:hypothetical protein
LRPEEQAVAAAGTSPIADTGTAAERPSGPDAGTDVPEADTSAAEAAEAATAGAGSEADPTWRSQVGEALPQLIETPSELEPEQQDLPAEQQDLPAEQQDSPAEQQADGPVWVEPVDGQCPTTHPVKAKLGSGIYHAPGGLNYDRTRPDRCYLTTEAAELDGLRKSKR